MTNDFTRDSLDAYLLQYKGHTRIAKALFIAIHCPPLQIDAYKIAQSDIQKDTLDVERYKGCIGLMNSALEQHQMPSMDIDSSWIQRVDSEGRRKVDKLERELKNCRMSGSGQNIYDAYTRLGDMYFNMGKLQSAIKQYGCVRDYCKTPDQILEMCFNMIKVHMESKNTTHIQSYLARAKNTIHLLNASKSANANARLRCYKALVLLTSNQPDRFEEVASTLCEIQAGSTLEVLSPQDVCIYGGLCALASFPRPQLRHLLSIHSPFKGFLEESPRIQEMIEAFLSSSFVTCLDLLENYRASLSLDMYMQPQVDLLFQSIRGRALIQYCKPFSAIDMRRMAFTFQVNIEQLEHELVKLIMQHKISARIDAYNMIIYTKCEENRIQAFEQSIEAGNNYERSAKALLLRLELRKKGLVVK